MAKKHMETWSTLLIIQFSSVQFSRVQFFVPHESQHARPPCPSTNSWSSSKFMCIESVIPSSHLILCHPLLLQHPNSSQRQGLSNESTLCMRWSNYWSFSFSISPSKEHPGLISFRMEWLDLLAF